MIPKSGQGLAVLGIPVLYEGMCLRRGLVLLWLLRREVALAFGLVGQSEWN